MVTTKRKLTFEEYLNYDDGTDRQYEFVDGELVEMPPESWENSQIAKFLRDELERLFSRNLVCYKDVEVETSGRARLPDVMLLRPEHPGLLAGKRGTVTRDMPPPALVIEVVSPGQENEDRDYRYKRSEYAATGIPEYWVVDPQQQKVTVFTLNRGLYEGREYTGDMLIESGIEGLNLLASQALQSGREADDTKN